MIDGGPQRTRTGGARSAPWALIGAALLILAIVALHTAHFHNRNLRQDELFTTHASQVLSLPETAQWMAENGVHPPGWRVLAVAWLKLVGISAPAARYSSTLITLIALALVYRLAADWTDRRTGLLAAFLLGTLNFTMFYMHELRPYPLAVLVTAGLQWSFLRWVRRPVFSYALIFVLLGVLAFQTHYFVGYVVIAELAVFVVLVRWDRVRLFRGIGLFAAIGLSLVAWIPPVLNRWVLDGGGKSYARPSRWETLELLYDQMQIRPHALGLLLLLAGILIPLGVGYGWLLNRSRRGPLRFAPEAPKLAFLLVPGVVLAASFAVNLEIETVTPRNLIVLLPSLAVIAAWGLRRLPWQAQVVALVLIAVPAGRDFRALAPAAPNREVWQFMAGQISDQDRVVTHMRDPYMGMQALAFYLLDEPGFPLDKSAMFHVHGDAVNFPGDRLPNRVFSADAAAVAQFSAFLAAEPPAVWYVESRPDSAMIAPFLEVLEADYTAMRSAEVRDPTDPRIVYRVVEYRRKAD